VPLPGGAPPAPSRSGSGPASGLAAAAPGPRLSSGLLAPQDLSPALPDLSPGSPNPGSPGPGVVASPAAAASPTLAGPVPPANSATARETPAARPNAVRLDAAGAPSDDAGAKPDGRIDIRALADCWIQVRSGDDQSIVFSRVLKTGETYHVPRAGLVLRTGNAGALAIAIDGKPAPTIGAIGTLRRNVALDPEALLAGTAVHG
jgi:cytoskeleton protein RodZ